MVGEQLWATIQLPSRRAVRARLRRLGLWLRLGIGGLSGFLILALHLGLYIGLLLLALREFLFGSGYIIYHNIAWPLTPHGLGPFAAVYTPSAWTGIGPDPAGFTRAWIDAPPVWLGSIAGSSLPAQKLFYGYVYFVEYGLAFTAATLFLHWFPSGLSGGRRELARLAFVGLTFVNPAALQWEAGSLVPFFWSVSILEISLFATLLGLRTGSLRYALLAGAVLGAGCTLDPRTLVWGWLFLAPLFLFALVFRRRKRITTALHGVLNLGAALPGSILTYAAYSWAGQASAPLRPATVPLLTWLSSNADPSRLFELGGYFITEITYGPPSLFAYGGPGTLAALGSPTYMVTTPDPISTLWLLSLTLLPVLAFSSLLFRSVRAYAVPCAAIALGALAMAGGSQLPVPGLLELEVSIGSLPVVGSIWQTVIGVPIYIQVVTEAMYIPMILVTVVYTRRKLLEVAASSRRVRSFPVTPSVWITLAPSHSAWSLRGRRGPTYFVLFVSAGLLLGSWQFLSGSFYPGGYSVGASPTGVPGLGSAAPVVPPAADVSIATSLATDPDQYAVYWPGATGFTYAWSARSTPSLSIDSPKPVAEPTGISFLVTRNLTADTSALLQSAGVRYVIIDNMSGLELNREFGTPSLSRVLQFFESSPGLRLVSTDGSNVWEFAMDGSPSVLAAGLPALAFPGSPSLTGVALGALGGLGISPVLLPGNGTNTLPAARFLDALPLSEPSSPVVIATATNLSAISAPSHVLGFGPNLTANSIDTTIASTGERALPSPYSNWTVSVWSLPGGSVSVDVPSAGGGGVELNHSGPPATVSMNYLSSLVTGSYRGIPVNPSSQVVFTASAWARSLAGQSPSVYANMVASNATAHNLVQFSSQPAIVPTTWTKVNISGVLPLGTAYFTLRLFSTFSGTVQLENLSIAWTALGNATGTFSGVKVDVPEGVPVHASAPGITGAYRLWLDASGNGTLLARGSGPWRSATMLPSGFHWLDYGNLTVGSGLDLMTNDSVSVAGLVLWPQAISVATPICTVSSVTSTAAETFRGAGAIGPGCVLVVHEVYSERWSLSEDPSASPLIDLFGQTALTPDRFLSSFTVSLTGVAGLSGLMAGFVVFSLMIGAIVIAWPSRRLHAPRRRF